MRLFVPSPTELGFRLWAPVIDPGVAPALALAPGLRHALERGDTRADHHGVLGKPGVAGAAGCCY